MKPTDNIERLMQCLRVPTSPALDDRILTDSLEALAGARQAQPSPWLSIIQPGRFLMHNRCARYAAAAIVIAVVGLTIASLTILQNGVSHAYAFTQTVQAMHSVQTLHVKFSRGDGVRTAESWAEFDPAGQVIRCCNEYPVTEDGHKIVYWQGDKASIWFKTKGGFRTIADKVVARRMLDMAMANDPKLLVTRLQEEQAKGLVSIETQPRGSASAPIVLVVTYLPASGTPDRRQVLRIDPATKIVTRIENCRQTEGQYNLLDRIEILEYNQPIDPAVFNPQLPEDIIRIDETTQIIDETTQIIGLWQGDMTDEQVAQETVRQFFQALIDKDYAKAGQLFDGLSAAKAQEVFGRMHVVRIISLGQATPHKLTGGYRVPITVEIEVDGQLHEWSPYGPFVRPIYSDPTRWSIHGGI